FAPSLGTRFDSGQHLRAPVREAAVVPRQQPRIGLADATDAKRVNEPIERNAAPCLDRPREVARRDLAPAFAFGDRRLARRQTKQIGGAVQPAFLVELPNGLLAEPV